MVILHVASLFGNKSAGPTISVPKNVEYGNKFESVALYNCLPNKLDGLIEKDKIFLMEEYPFISSLPEPYNAPDIVVFQNMYITKFLKLSKELKKRNIPYVVVPRGCLTSAAQNKKKYKKIIGNLLFFNRFIKNASSINFLTENEYNESRKFKFKNYFINGNGINLNSKYKEFPSKSVDFIVTFIGRVEWYHKGLDYLVEAVNFEKDKFREKKFKFNIYGPDRINSYDKLKEMINNYKIDDLIKIYNPIFDEEKEKVMLNTDLFIHTSRLEGQPNSVIEAISYGVPVFVTPGTNVFDIVKKYNLGFTSEFDIQDIAKNLLLSYESKDKFKKISENEKKYAKEFLSWDSIVKYNIEKYKELLTKK